MKTYEMVALAEENGRAYNVNDMAYQKDVGFVRKIDFTQEWKASAWSELGLQKFILCDGWQELKPKEMTIEEIEKELGYQIKIVNSKDE